PPDHNLCLSSVAADTDTHTETREPTLQILNVDLAPDNIDSCNDSTTMTLIIENAGPVDASNVDLVIDLPVGLFYAPGTAELGVGPDSSTPTTPIADPVVNDTRLVFYDVSNKTQDLIGVLQAAGGNDTLILKFGIRSACYTTSNVHFTLYYYDCCGDNQYSLTSNTSVTSEYPELSIIKMPLSSQVACGEIQTWTIAVTNLGDGNAQVVRVEDTLGNWISYVSSTPQATLINGQTYGWEFTNLAPGATRVFTITGRLSPDTQTGSCATSLRQNNARAIWGCGIGGDATDGDPTTTAYDCAYDVWANAAPAILQMPDLIINQINPTITCNGDGAFSGTITVRVRNQGDGPASGPISVTITDGKGWSGYGVYNGTINPGTNRLITVDTSTWSPNCHACDSPYVFSASVDAENVVCECNQENNSFSRTYTAPIPDLSIADIDFTDISCAADSLSGNVRVLVRNNGCAAANNVQVALTTDGCLSFAPQTVSSLAAGAQTTVTFQVSGPWVSCVNEMCLFTATIDPAGTVCECDGTNNTRSETYANPLPDLIVTDIDTSGLICENDAISGVVQVTVQNQGYGSATNVQVSLSSDGCLTFSNQTVTAVLTHGQSQTLSFPVNIGWSNCADISCQLTAR
ncbi:MAG: DUF11 domain-containing protein, partial [Synergistales bacterium]|nr:DUF11 domain-containing protein [Synergistales bacterium]